MKKIILKIKKQSIYKWKSKRINEIWCNNNVKDTNGTPKLHAVFNSIVNMLSVQNAILHAHFFSTNIIQ